MGFDDDQSWAFRMQERFAVPLYENHWGRCEVVEVDQIGDDESVAKLLDFGDVDKIVQLPKEGTNIFLAQRFRRHSGEDFSLRFSRSHTDNTIEYERLMNAYENPAATIPERYAFGRACRESIKNGFAEFYILDTRELVRAIREGDVYEQGPYQNGDGTSAVYYDLDGLDEAGVVIQSWDFDDDTDDDGQSGLSAFTDGGLP